MLLKTEKTTLKTPDARFSTHCNSSFPQFRDSTMVVRTLTPLLKGLIVLAAIAGTFVPQAARAQGESAVPFLLIAPNARADAMGESGTGVADDAAANFWNPAGLAFQVGQEVSLTHSAWLPQFQRGNQPAPPVSIARHPSRWITRRDTAPPTAGAVPGRGKRTPRSAVPSQAERAVTDRRAR